MRTLGNRGKPRRIKEPTSCRIAIGGYANYVGTASKCNFDYQVNETYLRTGNRSGVTVPSHERMIKEHLDASSDYERRFVQWNKARVTEAYYAMSQICYADGGPAKDRGRLSERINQPGWVFPDAFPAYRQELKNEVLQTIVNKVDSREARFQGLAPIVELRELRGSVKNLAAHLESQIGSYGNILRGRMMRNPKAAAAFLLKNASELWLEFNFGLKPLVSDVKSAAEAMAETMTDLNRNPYRVSAQNTDTWVERGIPANVNPLATSASASLPRHIRYEHEYTYRVAACVMPIVDASTDFYEFSHQWGFAFERLIPTAWALMPYSWVIDYFFNVDDYLNSTFRSDINYVYVTESYLHKVNALTTYGGALSAPAPLKNVKIKRTGMAGGTYVHYKRNRLGLQLPRQTLYFNRTDNWYNPARLVNLISILNTRNNSLLSLASTVDPRFRRHFS